MGPATVTRFHRTLLDEHLKVREQRLETLQPEPSTTAAAAWSGEPRWDLEDRDLEAPEPEEANHEEGYDRHPKRWSRRGRVSVVALPVHGGFILVISLADFPCLGERVGGDGFWESWSRADAGSC